MSLQYIIVALLKTLKRTTFLSRYINSQFRDNIIASSFKVFLCVNVLFQKYENKYNKSKGKANEWLSKLQIDNKAAYPHVKKLVDEKYK